MSELEHLIIVNVTESIYTHLCNRRAGADVRQDTLACNYIEITRCD